MATRRQVGSVRSSKGSKGSKGVKVNPPSMEELIAASVATAMQSVLQQFPQLKGGGVNGNDLQGIGVNKSARKMMSARENLDAWASFISDRSFEFGKLPVVKKDKATGKWVPTTDKFLGVRITSTNEKTGKVYRRDVSMPLTLLALALTDRKAFDAGIDRLIERMDGVPSFGSDKSDDADPIGMIAVE